MAEVMRLPRRQRAAGRCLVLFVTAVLGASVSPVAVAQGDDRNGPTSPGTTWRDTDGSFGAMLLLASYSEAGGSSTPPTRGSAIPTVSRAARGDVVTALILFHHCTPDRVGNCFLEADFTVFQPDGSPYSAHCGTGLWSDAAPPADTPQRGAAHLNLEIEATDPLGTYRIQALVRDRGGAREVLLEQTLVVSE